MKRKRNESKKGERKIKAQKETEKIKKGKIRRELKTKKEEEEEREGGEA